MAAQTSASCARGHLPNRHNGEPSVLESLSGSMRQFLTPEVWKQVKHAASQHGCRHGVRWTLQPLIMIAAIMTWCAGETDADRFVLSRSFYVQIHCPKRQRPGKAFSGFCKAMFSLPMPVWWAILRCRAVASFSLLADRMTMEGWLPLGCTVDDGMSWPLRWNSAWGSPTADYQRHRRVGDRLGQLDALRAVVLARRRPRRLVRRRPGSMRWRRSPKVLETCPWSATRATWLRVTIIAEAAVLVSDPALFAGQLYSLEMVKVEGFTEGEFWSLNDPRARASAHRRR